MTDLYSFLEKTSENSDFKAELCKRGGYVTFSNSGRRGGVKYFQIGLDSILQTLKDILDNLAVFSTITSYDERPWRDNGSEFFNDPVANANSTVQTKPLFSTLSKIIIWANQPTLDNIDPDQEIILTEDALKTAIEKIDIIARSFTPKQRKSSVSKIISKHFTPYLTALRTKPFMLLAGISGTGKSRIVREMAKACWKEGDEEYGKNNPKNFCMVQVKPNWHDSTELMGYVTRISGKPEYIAGDFIKFIVKAWYNEDTPFFLCLDEMNLAPVEQYFAEYLSVIESRKMKLDGMIATDPILKASCHRKDDGTKEPDEWFVKLVDNLLVECPNEKLFAVRKQFLEEGIAIPQNLFVVGTVNMDETTFSFSRKVLDRAMTIEMNEVDLHGGLEKGAGNEIGYIGNSIIGDAAEGCDIYEDNKDLCDQVLAYLVKVNAILEGTPFKIAYRTRNEFLMYAVNRQALAPDSQLWQTLDEMTSMKILSRIEGDEERTKKVLDGLNALVKEQIVDKIGGNADGTLSAEPTARHALPGSISAAKIDEMLAKLKATGFTSYWA